ncbi:MAG: ATP-dependent helicase [Candidatus Dormibacteria bacterium]
MAAATGLNEAQQQAVDTLGGQLLVLAGPGTGKTRVITHRYRNLLAQPGVGTENVVVLTFTEKAAREMEDRISGLCQTGFSELFVGTFHAFALRLLRDEGRRLPIPQKFDIAADVEQWAVMCEVLERLRPDELYHLPRPRDIALDLIKLLQRAKQEMAGPEDYLRVATAMSAGHQLGSRGHAQVAEVYVAYQQALLGRAMLDFDDIIYWCVRLLEADEDVLARCRARFSHVMVDEFQDTNFSQLRLVELLAGPQGNVAVVGDDDQSIYKFRGASVANLRRFRKVYPETSIVRLSENYRSTIPILAAANRLVSHNTERIAKTVTSDRPGPEVRLYAAPDAAHEVAWVVERIVELIEGSAAGGDAATAEPVPAGEVAVLVRTNAQLRAYTRALQRAGIPYQLSGGRGFLDQPEIKDLRALLQWACDPRDTQAACRVLAMPGVGLRAGEILRLAAAAERDQVAIEEVTPPPDLDPAALERRADILCLLEELRSLALRERVDEVLYHALERTRYVHLLDNPSEIQRRQAGANIDKFRDLVEAFAERDPTGANSTLAAFTAHLRAVEESGSEQAIAAIDTGAAAVNLMTVHQAKGLEFTAVFCPGLVEDRFPFKQQAERLTLPVELIVEEAPSRDPRMAEERRLAYVALTRTRTHAFVSWAARYEGSKKWKASRFLAEFGFMPGPDGSAAQPPAVETPPEVADPPTPPAAQANLPMAHPAVPELSVSYSKLDLYQRCPRAYQYAHVYRLPARPAPEAEFGVAVHNALRTILDDSRQALLVDPSGPAQGPLAESLRVFDEQFNSSRFSDPVNADLWQEKGRAMIRALHQKGWLSGRQLHVPPEQPFTLRLPGFMVRGVIDRIDREGARYRVVDYKTGEVKQDWQLERDMQLGIYAMAAEQVFGLKPVDLVMCYLEDALEVPVLKTTSQLQADQQMVEEAAAGIIAEDFTPRPEPWKCRHCDYRLVCDAAL